MSNGVGGSPPPPPEEQATATSTTLRESLTGVKGFLNSVSVSQTAVNGASLHATISVKIGPSYNVLKSGWFRGGSVFFRHGALVWNGRIPLPGTSPQEIVVEVRNDTGTTLSWNLNYIYARPRQT